MLRKYYAQQVGLVGRRVFCLLSLLLAGGFYFFVSLLDSYLAIGESRDSFTLDALFLIVFFSLTAVVAISAIVALVGRQKRSAVACRFLFVAFACLSFWFRSEFFSLADRVFLLLNERGFRNQIRAAGGGAAAVILQWQSSGSVNKLFAYSGSRSLPDGRLSLDEIDAFGGDLDEMRACRFYATHLRDNFYVLNADCR